MKNCPSCGKALERVPQSIWLNSDQYDAVKAGDWFCEACPDNGRGNSGLCYWWDHEIEGYAKEIAALRSKK